MTRYYADRFSDDGRYSPKIQRLVTPIRLQRRRHLRSLKRRRIERQKEQKTEYDALLSKRLAEKKEKVASAKAAHKKYVSSVVRRVCQWHLTTSLGPPKSSVYVMLWWSHCMVYSHAVSSYLLDALAIIMH